MEDAIVIRRHPRTPLWKGYTFDAYKGTPAERKFEVRRSNGNTIGDIVFNEFSRKSCIVETPWGKFEVVMKSIFTSKYAISRSGSLMANASFNFNQTKLDLSFAQGPHLVLAGKMLDFGYVGEADLGKIEVPWDGAFTSDGVSIKDLPSKQMKMEYKQQKEPSRGLLDIPRDKEERKATAEDPFYSQWRMIMPGAYQKRDDMIGVIAVLVCIKWLNLMETAK